METACTPGAAMPANKFAGMAAVLAVVAGVVVLAGWDFDIAALKSILPGWVAMKANTAVCFILTGIALLLVVRLPTISNPQFSAFLSHFARLSILLTGLIGLLSLCEYVFGWNPGFDQWLFYEPPGAEGTSDPGRMAPEAALSFVLLSVSLWIGSGPRKKRWALLASVILGLLVVALALAAILSYFAPNLGVFGWFGLTIMAMHSAVLFALLGVAIIAISWQRDILQWALDANTTAAFACGMAVLVLVGFNINRSQFWLGEINRKIAHSEEALGDIVGLQIKLTEAQAHIRGYVITGNKQFLDEYVGDITDYNKKMDAFRRLIAGNPHQQQQISSIDKNVDLLQRWLQQFIDAPRTGTADAVRDKMDIHGDDLLNNISTTFAQIRNGQRQLINKLKQESKSVARFSYLTIAAGTFASLTIFLIILFSLNLAVNERRRAQEAVVESEKKFRTMYQSSRDALILLDENGILDCNTSAMQMFGCSAQKECLHRHLPAFSPLVQPDGGNSASLADRYIATALRRGECQFEWSCSRFDGAVFPVEVLLTAMELDGRRVLQATVRDITTRKLAEARIQRLTQLYAALSQCNQAIVRCTDEDGLFPQICQDAVQFGGMKMAWIGLLDEASKQVKPVASYGDGVEYLENIRISTDADDPSGQGPAGIVLRGKQPFWCQDFMNDPATALRHEPGERFGWASMASLPLCRNGAAIGVFTLYSGEMNAFDEDARSLLVEMAADVGFALDNFAREAERKRAEKLLEENERHFRAVTESANDAIITATAAGNIVDWNAAAERLFGHKAAEVIGRPLTLLMPEKFRDQHSTGLARVAAGGTPRLIGKTIEVSGLRKDGSEFPLDLSLAQWQAAGSRFFTAIIRDITGRKLVEEALHRLNEELENKVAARTAELKQANIDLGKREEENRSVIDHMLDCVITIDEKGIIHSVNPAVEKTFGYTREEMIGKNVFMLMPEPHRSAHDGYLERYLHTDRPRIIGIERGVEGLHKNGGRIMLDIGVSEYLIEGKRYFTGILRDVSEQMRIMADMEQARHDAEQANKAKSDFLASMSHEIRTPMNGVIGMLEVLQQSSLKGPQMEMVNIIHDSAFSLLAIIDDILDFSKIEAGKLYTELAPMSVAGTVEKACETLDRMAEKKEVELMLFTDPSIPATVMGDPVRLRQILVNLANNAIKFSSGQERRGKVSVRAALIESTPERVMLEFRVTDNGIGMDEATRERLFTPFTQADTSTTRTYGGTGLGLAICRQLVNIMGGEIAVQSEPGRGSIFDVRLPFALPPEQPDAGQTPPRVAGLSCLVAGDAESLADDLAAYLRHGDALVERVTDMASAKEWVGIRPSGLCIVIIDAAGGKPPLVELRAAARTRPGMEAHFVVIGRGSRRRCRSEAADLVMLDGEVMHRCAFLEAVAIAAGRASEHDWEAASGGIGVAPIPLPYEEARRQCGLILVAEDNEINQKVIMRQLALLGKAADVADNGRDALKLWQDGGYGILLTDLHMPEMDGYELTAAIRAAEAGKTHIPIIAFTANALKGEAEHCRAVGMDDYLSKPVQLVNLKATLEKWMAVTVPPSVGTTSPEMIDTVRAEPVEAHSPFDKPVLSEAEGIGANGLQTSATVPVDVNVLKKLVGDDEATIREFLRDFRLSAAKIAAELRAACMSGQSAAAGALAHKLKSSARSVGALALGELCAEMERAGKAGDVQALMALSSPFGQELANVERFLEGY